MSPAAMDAARATGIGKGTAASYSISSMSDLPGGPLAVSRFLKGILEEHRRYFGDRTIMRHDDVRPSNLPPIGPTIREPGLAERWGGYDAGYREETRISRFWVSELADATVFPPLGLVAVGDTFVRETLRSGDQLRTVFPSIPTQVFRAAMSSPASRIEASAPPVARHVAGTSFLLGFGVFENYFNWTLRYTSRIALYQACGEEAALVVPERRKGYVADTLEFFGVPESNVRFLDAPTTFERLILVSPVAYGRYELSPLITQTLRDHPRVRGLWRRPKRRLYVPRHDVGMRVVVNEAAVEAALAAMGFEVFDNARHPVGEQVRAFRDASIVVSPHGAGLSNIVFSDPGTPVVEIVPEGYDQGVTSYRSLSDLFGLRYLQLFGREVALDRKGNRCNSDIAVDVEELVAAVRPLIA